MYAKFFKRLFDFLLSFFALIALSPLFLILSIIGAIAMRGNPFFTQERPGKNEKIFKLIKFRTMTNRKDENGELLPDAERLVPYGKFLRSTSIDELPSLVNVLFGQLSLVGPRPLLVRYLPLYNEHQKQRHDVRPGLTGYAQVHGRNTATWEEKFDMDVWYTKNVKLSVDLKVLFDSVFVVLKREGISSATSVTMEEFKGTNVECEKENTIE